MRRSHAAGWRPLLLLAAAVGFCQAAQQLPRKPRFLPSSPTRLAVAIACAEHPDSRAVTSPEAANALASQQGLKLLDALDLWLRRQTVATILPQAQAAKLLRDLRDDRRFWAQQRRQFARIWVLIEQGMRDEQRPLEDVLGPVSSAQLLEAFEQMEEDPELVRTVIRSELVERLLGHVLYQGIFEFAQSADLIGSVVNSLPIIGPLRQQLVAGARENVDALLGAQISRFLGEYSASAAENALGYALSEENKVLFRRERRKIGEKLLKKPIGELVVMSQLEMAILRDSIWTAVQEMRLPNESELLAKLYDEFGEEPFTILLPSDSQATRGDAPLLERGRVILRDILIGFLQSEDWASWSADHVASKLSTLHAVARPRAQNSHSAGEPEEASAMRDLKPGSTAADLQGSRGSDASEEPPPGSPSADRAADWDGWD